MRGPTSLPDQSHPFLKEENKSDFLRDFFTGVFPHFHRRRFSLNPSIFKRTSACGPSHRDGFHPCKEVRAQPNGLAQGSPSRTLVVNVTNIAHSSLISWKAVDNNFGAKFCTEGSRFSRYSYIPIGKVTPYIGILPSHPLYSAQFYSPRLPLFSVLILW